MGEEARRCIGSGHHFVSISAVGMQSNNYYWQTITCSMQTTASLCLPNVLRILFLNWMLSSDICVVDYIPSALGEMFPVHCGTCSQCIVGHVPSALCEIFPVHFGFLTKKMILWQIYL